jgi:ABC-2 type transport system ATP-binding protein
MSEEKNSIVVDNLTKSFKIPLDKGKSVKSHVLGRATRGYKEFTPLNHVSFTVKKGEFFGILGRNGSGKSTLLKTIAGIYRPTAGDIKVNGVLVPFIELGVGFSPQLSGRENVYLNGAILGYSNSEMDEMYDDIVSFAELEDFMGERLQNYSSGMQVRLAFSIAIRAQGDVLLLDEVLAVGDADFQRKCFEYFDQLKQSKKTVILVTHSMSNVERYCDRALLLEAGKVKFIGTGEEAAEKYREVFRKKKTTDYKEQIDTSQSLIVESAKVIQSGSSVVSAGAEKDFTIRFRLLLKDTEYTALNATCRIYNSKGDLMFSSDTMPEFSECFDVNDTKKPFTVEFGIENYYTDGNYRIGLKVIAAKQDGEQIREEIFNNNDIAKFAIDGRKRHQNSLFHPPVSVKTTNTIARKELWG